MIKVAIVDDNEEIVNLVRRQVEEEIDSENGDEVFAFTDVESFLQMLQEGHELDILISDIEMPEMNGIELGKKINRLCRQIYLVYLTSYAQYAAESYRIDAYQYIMKEDLDVRLPIILKRLFHRIQKEKSQYRMIGTPTSKETVYYRSIVCVCKEKGSKYVKYLTVNGIYKERITMSQLLKELHSEEFVPVGRGYIINLNHIANMHGNVIYMDNGDEIYSGRGRVRKVKEQINLYRGKVE